MSQVTANRRLRVLFDLHCINRHFPPVPLGGGSSKQHITLGKMGARLLGLGRFREIKELPSTFRHTVLTTEFRLEGRLHGLPWGEVHYKLAQGVVPDIYYPTERMAVEIDCGTENHNTLRAKATRYKEATELDTVVFVTTGSIERGAVFLTPLQYRIPRLVRTRFENLPKLFKTLQ